MTAPAEPLAWEIVAATGHRPQHLSKPQRDWIREQLALAAVWLRDHAGTRVALSGLALGVDTWWAQAALAAGLTLGAHVPCPPNPAKWGPKDITEFERLVALADPAYSHQYADTYTRRCMDDRNEGMLAAARAGLYVWLPGKRSGGTWNAVQVGRRLALPGIHFDPAAMVKRFVPPGTVRLVPQPA